MESNLFLLLFREMNDEDKMFEKKEKIEKKLKIARQVAVIFIPIFCSIFIILFFGIGFSKTLLTE